MTVIEEPRKEETEITIVVPLFNEENNINFLYKRLIDSINTCKLNYEIIFVNDGSNDETEKILKELRIKDSKVKLISFSRNFGHQNAITAGLKYASGKATVIIDGDLQDPPELIVQLVEKWKEGYKVVYAKRTSRLKENPSKRLFAFIYYRLLNKLSDVPIPVDTGDFCLMDSEVVSILNHLPERNRYIRGLRSWIGFKQTSVIFERQPREEGQVKYNFAKSLQLGIDGLIAFSKVPLRLATFMGLLVACFSIFMAVLILYWRLVENSPLIGYTTILMAIFFIGAVQLITVGILGEYLGRIYEEVKLRPYYIIELQEGFDQQHISKY